MDSWERSEPGLKQANVPVVDNWEDLLNSDNDETDINNTKVAEVCNKLNEEVRNKGSLQDLNEFERQRKCQELVEAMDGNAMDDLFDGFLESRKTAINKPSNTHVSQTIASSNIQQDTFSNLVLNSYGKVESTAFKMADCIRSATAKSPAWLRFIDICLNEVFPKLDLKDLKTLKKKIDQQLLNREKEEREKSQQKKKPNDIATLSRNFKEELDIFDGIDSLDDSDDY